MRSQLALQQLAPEERAIILTAMRLILTDDRYIRGWEFQTRLGVTRQEMATVLTSFPDVDQVGDEETVHLSIHNAQNEVCNAWGSRIPSIEWKRWFTDVSRDEVKATFRKWIELEERSS
jgi:hypothetical protein